MLPVPKVMFHAKLAIMAAPITCSICRERMPAPKQRLCLPCKAAYAREWRKTHPLKGSAKVKDRVRSYANAYQKRGKLVPQPCQKCGANKVEKHHPDYSQPLKVEWLCRPCHLTLHREAV